jgi:hypothetical protein
MKGSYVSPSELAEDEEKMSRYVPHLPSGTSQFKPLNSPKQFAKQYPRIDAPMLKEGIQYEDE